MALPHQHARLLGCLAPQSHLHLDPAIVIAAMDEHCVLVKLVTRGEHDLPVAAAGAQAMKSPAASGREREREEGGGGGPTGTRGMRPHAEHCLACLCHLLYRRPAVSSMKRVKEVAPLPRIQKVSALQSGRWQLCGGTALGAGWGPPWSMPWAWASFPAAAALSSAAPASPACLLCAWHGACRPPADHNAAGMGTPTGQSRHGAGRQRAY